MVLATLVVAGKTCAVKPNDFPLNVAIAKLGQDLMDFLPDAGYSALVEVKTKKAFEFVEAQGQMAPAKVLQEILNQFLPDVFASAATAAAHT